MSSAGGWFRLRAALVALGFTACVAPEPAPRAEDPPSQDHALTSAPFDVSAVVRQVHFAYRAVGDHWEGGHSTYGVVATPRAVAVTPIDRARRGPAVTFTAERPGAGALADEGQLALARGEAREELRNAPEGVEQQWTFATRPAGGDLVVRLRVTGAAYAGATASGLHFADARTGLGVRYGHATWVDARGESTSVPAEWQRDAVVLTVPAAALEASEYPAVLDPVISPEVGVDEPVLAPDVVLTDPAIASDGHGYLVVWVDGGRVLGARLDEGGAVQEPSGFVLAPDPADAQQNSRDGANRVAVASKGHGYLVAWSSTHLASSNSHPIRFTAVSAEGVVRDLGGLIAANGSGDDLSVGSNGSGYLLTWSSFSSRVVGARVSADGVLLDAVPLAIGGDSSSSPPAVASDGRDYMVAWTSHVGVQGVLVRAGGAVDSPFAIERPTLSIYEAPTYGTPALVFGESDYFVAWSDGVHSTDLLGARVTRDGHVRDPGGITISHAPNAQFAPHATFDGRNFVVVWADARDSEPCPPCDPAVSNCTGCDAVREDRFVSAAIVGARVHADGVARDPDGVILAAAAPHQNTSAVASDGERASVLVWGGPGGILGRKIARNGRPRGHHTTLIAAAPALASAPAVASDGRGYLIVWQDHRGTDWDIFGARLDREGELVDPTGLAISTASGDQGAPAVAFDGRRYLVAWQDHRGADWDIYSTRVGRDGEVRNPDGLAISTSPGDQIYPALTGSLVIWDDLRACDPYASVSCDFSYVPIGAVSARIFGTRVGRDGHALDPEGIPISAPGARAHASSIAHAGATDLVAWVGDGRVHATRVGPTGVLGDVAGVVLSEAGAATPTVATDGNDFLAAWSRSFPLTRYRCYSSHNHAIEGVRVSRDGRVLDPAAIAIAVPPTDPATGMTSQNLYTPTAAFDGDGYLVAWESQTLIACDGFYAHDLLGAQVTTAGAVIDPPLSIETSLPDASRSPSIASDGAGHALVVYEHASSLMSGRTTIRARLLTLPASQHHPRHDRDDDPTTR